MSEKRQHIRSPYTSEVSQQLKTDGKWCFFSCTCSAILFGSTSRAIWCVMWTVVGSLHKWLEMIILRSMRKCSRPSPEWRRQLMVRNTISLGKISTFQTIRLACRILWCPFVYLGRILRKHTPGAMKIRSAAITVWLRTTCRPCPPEEISISNDIFGISYLPRLDKRFSQPAFPVRTSFR